MLSSRATSGPFSLCKSVEQVGRGDRGFSFLEGQSGIVETSHCQPSHLITSEGWRRGWDSNPCGLLKTKNLTVSGFLTIRQIRTKAWVETRIEHAD